MEDEDNAVERVNREWSFAAFQSLSMAGLVG